MMRFTGLALAAFAVASAAVASAGRCPGDCRAALKAEARSCRAACPKRRPGKKCRAACARDLKARRITCKTATDPTPPECGATTTTTAVIVTTTTTTIGGTTTSTVPNATMATLTIDNYLSWCSVSVNGGLASTAASQVLQFPKDAVVNLNADKANATFVFGYWFGTAGDAGPSHDTSMATIVTMNTDKTVQACCPFASAPNTPCPAP